jgi:hypothetical protein
MSESQLRQLKEHRAQVAFARNLGRLWLELRMGTPRRHLDVLLELCTTLLVNCGPSQLTDRYRVELHSARIQVSQRSNLRLVK